MEARYSRNGNSFSTSCVPVLFLDSRDSGVKVNAHPMRLPFASLCLAAAMGSGAACADDINIAAASDLQFALKDVAARFEQTAGHRVRVTFGSSGNFFAQISNGAPFDVFLSADTGYPQRLIDAGAADRDSFFVYGTGTIVLWVPLASPLDPNKGLKMLLDPAVRKVAL